MRSNEAQILFYTYKSLNNFDGWPDLNPPKVYTKYKNNPFKIVVCSLKKPNFVRNTISILGVIISEKKIKQKLAPHTYERLYYKVR
jgi:hypothetical protein